MYLLYKFTCRVNNKAYVGFTSKTLEWRWNRHVRAALLGSNAAFHRAIRMHGADVWDKVILETCSTRIEACSAEIRLIDEHKTYAPLHPKLGYNMTTGGDGGCLVSPAMKGYWRGRKFTPEHRQKISEAGRGRKRSLVSVEKSRLAHVGRKRSEETCLKIKLARSRQICSEETRKKMSATRQSMSARRRFQRTSRDWFLRDPK